MMDNDRIAGVCNLTAPAPVTMDNFGRSLGRVMNRPYWLPVPGFALRMALGEMSMLVLEGQRVFPRNLLEAGYVFRYSELGQALDNLIGTSLFH
jgi:NAD dependent epimerase/dehydratase family enzyme